LLTCPNELHAAVVTEFLNCVFNVWWHKLRWKGVMADN